MWCIRPHRKATCRLISAIASLAVLVGACAPPPPTNRSGLQAVTAVPTLDRNNLTALCAAADTNWERDWPRAIQALEAVATLEATCPGGTATHLRLYQAYYAYGTLLEERNRQNEAIGAYETALTYNRVGEEAAEALRRLGVYTPAPPGRCTPAEVMAALAAVPPYEPTEGAFVQVEGQHFSLDGAPFTVQGVNYYPRDFPWRRFLTEMDVNAIDHELNLLQSVGINTLRIFLWHEALFTCIGNGAVPVAPAFARLDAVVQKAAERNLKLIITLNDLPDLSIHPLYRSPQHTVDQMLYIVTRYRDEPAILAWDLRNAGDLDYLGNGTFERTTVLEWLVRTAFTIRQTDPNHLITASWRHEAEATIPAVDFVSFQHFESVESLRERIAVLMSQTNKPIVLSAVGYSSFETTELAQRNALYEVLQAVQNNDLAGWLVWTAFDFPLTATCIAPDCPSPDSPDHHFGLWNTSYFPKLAVDVVRAATGTTP